MDKILSHVEPVNAAVPPDDDLTRLLRFVAYWSGQDPCPRCGGRSFGCTRDRCALIRETNTSGGAA